jgi:uncharacterized protein
MPLSSASHVSAARRTDGVPGVAEVTVASVNASAIYVGSVRHRRFEPREHAFRYRLALAYIDLDELPSLLGGRLVASLPGPVRFRRRHYLGEEQEPLARAVRDVVRAQVGVRSTGPIRLLTNLSTFGHCFNPVSFYYCMDESAECVEAVVAEVTNTPWGERHAYVLARGSEPSPVLAGNFAKALHVSPFMGMDDRYEWRMTTPGDTLSVHIANTHEGRLAFDATLAMRRHELTSTTLARMSARYPASALRMLALIYAQAARLKLKGVPTHPHPKQGFA